LSLITATAGFGALSASIWIGLGRNNNLKIQTKLVFMLILGLIMSSIIGCISDMYLMALAFIIVGFTSTVIGIGTQTIIQMEVEDLFRARVLTWWSSLSFGSLTVGGILLGLAGEYIPLNIGLIIMPIIGFIIFKLVVKLHFKNKFI